MQTLHSQSQQRQFVQEVHVTTCKVLLGAETFSAVTPGVAWGVAAAAAIVCGLGWAGACLCGV